jgi:formylglycine-generating enzyme required for sulfatase activity/serine/threonine protein kinase
METTAGEAMPPNPPTTQSNHDLDFGPTLRGLREGLKVFGRYTLVRLLGRGGMGVVWLARDEKLDLDIALKFLPENLVGDESALADLRHETRRCMKLHHTHIVHVYDLVDGDATAAIAMEYVDGRPLSALRAEKAARVMDVADVLPLLRQTCEALTYAHETAKIVHHDLKPANLMLTKDGMVKVMDFGIASSLSDSLSKHSRVGQQSGSGSGTLPYMSPQQIMGYPPSVADDVYSLGATLYELLTGKPPFFRGDLTRQIESITPPRIAQRREELQIEGAAAVPEAWEEVIAGCLEKESEKRPKSVREVWERLNGAGAAVPSPVAKVAAEQVVAKAAVSPASTKARSRKPVILTLIAGVVMMGLVLLLASRQKEAGPDDAAQAEAIDTAAAARLAQEKARQMAEQVERERLLKEAEMKKPTAGPDFGTASIGDTRVVDLGEAVKLTLCYCPPGSFVMGSPAGEADRSENENQVQVKISEGFWMGQHEVTQGQWAAVMGSNPSSFKGDDLPVEQVSWEDAQTFITKLNQSAALPAGWKYALPSEAQWEYACRAGTESVFSFGDVLNGREANCDGNYPYGTSTKGPSLGKTSEVGSYQANGWGLYDMHGNVYEWCADWYGEKLGGGSDPEGASTGSYRVNRGGSWISLAQDCRAANRAGFTPEIRYGNLGFRLAAVPAGAR